MFGFGKKAQHGPTLKEAQADLAHEIALLREKLNQIELSIAFLQQMAWGIESKSIPPFMLGLTETQEHKDMPGVGMFRDTEEED